MKIGIMSDLHLGYRQYGLIDREEDFYKQYELCILQCIAYECDIVIIAGDIFDTHKPSPKSIHVFEAGIKALNKNDITVLNIVGNHTQLQVKDHFSPDKLFEDKYEYFLLDEGFAFNKNIFICGLPYYANHSLEKLKKHISKYNKIAKDQKFSILVLHQEFQEYCGFTGAHMSINDIEIDNFDYVICGHIHSRVIDMHGKAAFIQPGSIERMNTKEAQDEVENGKGITIIEIDDTDLDSNYVDFVRIENFRKIFSEEVTTFEDPKDTVKEFERIMFKVSKCRHNPILHLKIFDKFDQLELCKDWESKFADNTLMTRMNYHNNRDFEFISDTLEDEDLTPLNGLKNAVKDWGDDEINLAIELFSRLSSKDKEVIDSAKNVADEYYDIHFDI